jgi:acetyl esterase/lipase
MIYPAVRDAKAAVRWVRANAATLGIDPEVIVAYGSSAGGCSAITLGTNDEVDYKDDLGDQIDPTLSSTHPNLSSNVAAVVSHWGAMHGIEAMEQHDNTSRVTKRFAPTVAFHGQSDYAVSPREEQELCTRLVLAGVPCEYHPLIGYGHDPTFACKCCATNCTKTDILDCSGNAFERVKDGCELRLSGSNRTLDEQALSFLAANIGALSFAGSM